MSSDPGFPLKSLFVGLCTAWIVVVLGVLVSISTDFRGGSDAAHAFDTTFTIIAGVLGFALGFGVHERRSR